MIMKILHIHDIPTTKCNVGQQLKELGHRVKSIPAELLSTLGPVRFELIVLDVPACRLKKWLQEANQHFALPVFWWCEEQKPVTTAPYQKIDGMLFCGMNPIELQWSLLVGLKNYEHRIYLEREYTFLSSKFEERKRIDQAKAIISNSNNISEAKAYEMMRTQAMSERRKLIDIAEAVITTSRLNMKPGHDARRRKI